MGNNSNKPQLTPQQEEDLRFAEIEKRYQNEKEQVLKRNDLTVEMKSTIIDNQEKSKKLEEQRIIIQKLETNLSNIQSQYAQSSTVCQQLIEKYHLMVFVFAITLLLGTILCFFFILYTSMSMGRVDYRHTTETIISPSCENIPASSPSSSSLLSSSSSPSNPLIITSKILEESFATFYETYCKNSACDSSHTTSMLLWEMIRTTSALPKHQLSYSSLLSLFSLHILPALSFSLIAASVAVVLSSLGAGFSLVYFWQVWSPSTRFIVGLVYCTTFIIVGVYMHRTSTDRTLEIPAGVLVTIGILCSQLLIPAIYQLITPTVANINEAQATVLSDGKAESFSQELKDPLMTFLSPFLLLVTSCISLILIPFAPLGSFVVLSLNLTIFSLVHRIYTDRQFLSSIIFFLNLLIWIISFTPSNSFNNPFSLSHYLNPSPDLINPHYPIVSYISLWMEFTSGAICLLSLIFLLYRSHQDTKLSDLAPHSALYVFSLSAIYVGMYFQNFSTYFYGHIGILVFSIFSFPLSPPIIFLSNFLLIYTSHYIQSQSILLIGPIESLSNICLGPIGILIFTLCSLFVPENNWNKDMRCLLAFLGNVIVIFISAQLSRSLMFVVGLMGIASCLIWFGFMRIKGQGIFIFILGLFSVLIIGGVINNQK